MENGVTISPVNRNKTVVQQNWIKAVQQNWNAYLYIFFISLVPVQILFIGDSTNRGIAHYVTERLNGSLTEWDRTHDARVYDNINARRTVISFAYYPQFWMPPGQRPLFEASLLQLLKMYVS